MYIHSHGSLVGRPVDDITYYKQEVSRYTQLHFRRANRFVLLSLAGAYRCVHGHEIHKKTAVYLTTENGNLGDTEAVLDQIFHQHQFPMPYNFINTMSNTASFYVAQSLNLSGRNITFSSKQLSFERGIELLRSDLLSQTIEAGLIGGVDEACFSKQQFEAKFHQPYATFSMIEGSCWLLIKADAEKALGEIRSLDFFTDLAHLLTWIGRQPPLGPAMAGYGILVSREERDAIAAALPDSEAFDYIASCGYHDSATARGVTAFLERDASSRLIHISKDFRGQFVALVVDKY